LAKAKLETTIIQAEAYWCKLIGKPRDSYDGKHKEWTVDIVLDKAGLKSLKDFGIDPFYVKKGKTNKDGTINYLTGKPVLKLVRKSVRSDGSPANPVQIRDATGEPWNGDLIGNGSVVNIKIMKFEVALPNQPRRMKPYLLEMQVWDLVLYEGGGSDGGFPTKEKAVGKDGDDFDFGENTNHQKDVDFDDEIPF